MKIYSIICTRDKELKPVTKELVDKLSSLPAKVILMVNQESIFSGYKKAFESVNPEDTDIFILCHDDIEINEEPKDIVNAVSIANAEGYGFVGVAGTKLLGVDAVWWNQARWHQGHHSGQVHHLDKQKGTFYPTYYGQPSKEVVLDGVFLAASAKTLRTVGLEKPSYLSGDWDFYDLHYTLTAFEKGLTNVTVLMRLAHHSSGELVGREGWETNRRAFIDNHSLPVRI